jgi:hypothetical protein
MHPRPTSVQFPENIQFTNISNVSPSKSPASTATTTPKAHPDRDGPAPFPSHRQPHTTNGHSACPPPAGPKQADAFSARSSANDSGCAAEESLFDTYLWNFSTPSVSNELRNARTSHPCERGAGFLKI